MAIFLRHFHPQTTLKTRIISEKLWSILTRIDNLRLYRLQFITNIPDGMAARFSIKKGAKEGRRGILVLNTLASWEIEQTEVNILNI